MSLFGSFRIGGLGMEAQSRVISNVSDNLANAQTVGFKRIDTHFDALVTNTSSVRNDAGGVRATPVYMNHLQGTLFQSEEQTAMSIAGNGFFSVRKGLINSDGSVTLDAQEYYTRRGDFELSRSVDTFDTDGVTLLSSRGGYIVNGGGYYLMGYAIDEQTGLPGTTLGPMEVASLKTDPVPTTILQYAANLPAGAATGEVYPQSSIVVYDDNGDPHDVDLSWTKMGGGNQWQLTISVPDDATPISQNVIFEFNGPPAGTISALNATYAFDAALGTSIAADNTAGTLTLGSSTWAEQGYTVGDVITLSGTASNNGAFTITALNDGIATVVPAPTTEAANTGFTATRAAPGMRLSNTAGVGAVPTIIAPTAPDTTASLSLAIAFPGATAQTMTFDFGDIGLTTGMTQFAASTVQVTGVSQNGLPTGSFKNINIDNGGFVVINYDNGQSRRVYQIPLANFSAPNQLQRESGGAFTTTVDSGAAQVSNAGSNGTGNIVANSLENSNVDIGNEFTKMIQSQRAYSANAQTVKVAGSMIEELSSLAR